MKHWLLLLPLLPFFVYPQSRKKKKLAEEKANAELVAHLAGHRQYLAGEKPAMQYIIGQYKQMELAPAGNNGYLQEFEISEGKQIDTITSLEVGGKKLLTGTDYFPLAFSAAQPITGSPAMVLSEAGQPWFKDLKDLLEENGNNPHVDVEEEIKKMVKTVAAKNATALFVYNSSALADHIRFNRNDTSAPVKLPVVFITRAGYTKYFSDHSATLDIRMNIRFSQKKRKAYNLVGLIDNQASHTVILGAHYHHPGYGEQKAAPDSGHRMHEGADEYDVGGTAALMELTRLLKKSAPLNNNYLILHFFGEEQGLPGSTYWINHPSVAITPNYMINMDMAGSYDSLHKPIIGGYNTSPAWREVFSAAGNNVLLKSDSSGSSSGNHAAFYRKEIPVLFFSAGNQSNYHKATDDWSKPHFDNEKEILKLVYHMIELTDSKGKLTFNKTHDARPAALQ